MSSCNLAWIAGSGVPIEVQGTEQGFHSVRRAVMDRMASVILDRACLVARSRLRNDHYPSERTSIMFRRSSTAAQDQAAFDGALINAMASFSGPPMPPK